MPHRSPRWIWAGWVVFALVVVVGVVYLRHVGLDKADKLCSVVGVLVGLTGLIGPFLLPRPPVLSGSPAPSPTSGVSPASVDLRGSQGVQINQGGTNTQTNHFGAP